MKNGYDWIIAVAFVRITEFHEKGQAGEAVLVECLGIMQGKGIEIPTRLTKMLEQNEPVGVLLVPSIVRHILPMGKKQEDEIVVCLAENFNLRNNEKFPFTALFVKESHLEQRLVLGMQYALELTRKWRNLDPQKEDVAAEQAVRQIIAEIKNENSDLSGNLHNIRNALAVLRLRIRIAELQKEHDININPAEN